MANENLLRMEIAGLKQELAALREENEMLTDRAEDFLLVGIISEKVGLAESEDEAIEIMLECISSLKDIYYSAYCTCEGNIIKTISDYAPMLASSLAGQSFSLDADILQALENNEYLFVCEPSSPIPDFIPDKIQNKQPKAYCLIPVHYSAEKHFSSVFLFVFYIQELEYIQSVVSLLYRGIEVTCAKIEFIDLLQHVSKLKESLEEKVKHQTKEIVRANILLVSLIDSIPDLIFYKDQEGKYLGCNTAFCEFSGCAKDEIIGHTDFDIFDKEFAEFFRKQDRKMLINQGKTRRNEEWFCYPDGKKILLDTLRTDYKGIEGNVLGIIGISRDITEQKRTEKTLEDERTRLSVTLKSIGDAVITTDAEGYITSMNPIAEQLTNWSNKDARGQSVKMVFSIFDESNQKPIANPIEKVMATGEIIYLSNHTMLIAKDGTKYQISDSAAPIRDGDGDIQGMVLVFSDVSEQYHLREAANKSRRDLLAIMNNSPAVIYVKDRDSRFTFINKELENFLQMKMQDVVGKKTGDIFPKEIADEMVANDKAVLAAGHALESEETATHNDGLHTYSTVKFPLFDDEGNIYAVCGVSTDITERIESEEVLSKLQYQLHQAQKMDALGNLTGGIAHDYNNMLGVVLGYADLLKNSLSDHQPALAKYAHEIIRAGERGAGLTKKLLAFSRKKASREDSLNLNSLLQDEQQMLEKTLTVRIKLVFDLQENLWPVWLDDSDMEDAILNMSINAMHAIEGNGQLTIQTRNQGLKQIDAQVLGLRPDDYVLLSITDTGCGMDDAVKGKIFEPFFSTKGERGSGLGLSQVYGFVQRSGGVIKVHSERAQGSCFLLYFPRHHEDTDNESSTEASSAINFTGHERILVVDDEQALLKLTCKILEQQGFNVIAAENAKKALAILEHETVDLLITDIVMPEMDGHQLAAMVKEKYPEIKIQLASGFVDDCNMGMVDESLKQNILYKPINAQVLLQRIRELFGRA